MERAWIDSHLPVWDIVDIRHLVPDTPPDETGRPVTVAIDGRSASGKTTLSLRLAALSALSCVVHTDDVAWHTAMFDWGPVMTHGILQPVARRESVTLRPHAWDLRSRPGSIDVPAATELLIIEGAGSGRREFAAYTDALIWIHGDPDEVTRRERQRVARGEVSEAFVAEWLAAENAFFADERPWERATFIVAGSPQAGEGETQISIAGPSR